VIHFFFLTFILISETVLPPTQSSDTENVEKHKDKNRFQFYHPKTTVNVVYEAKMDSWSRCHIITSSF
jgi:hypothetical protein